MAFDFRAGFGEYTQCTVRNSDRSMKSRTEDCIVMLPTGNRTGSIKMLSIRTGKLVSRDQFKLLPMPSTVIARLNDMAAREGRKIVTRTNMAYDLVAQYGRPYVHAANRRPYGKPGRYH